MERRDRPRSRPLYTTTRTDENEDGKKDNIYSVPVYMAVLFLLIILLMLSISILIERSLPTQLKIKDEKDYRDRFIGERSQNHLKQLTSIGPRVTGSYENEELAVKFLQTEISLIQQMAHPNHLIELDTQVVSGSYYLDFKPYGVTNVYKNVQNVIVRFSPKGQSLNSSLLLNAHFDSVPTSPGATDDGISCTTMLEILRVLANSDQTYRHNIIFLFNGAEENPLQAAHGFITKHKWAPEVKAVINLEAVGGGGKEVVFQAGPGHPWIMRYYSAVAPHPRAQVVGEELFQSNFIPSDTDFRLFRDFGKVPGIDLAFIRRGYVYHTHHDNVENVDEGSYQHIGDNILALTRALANSEELDNTQEYESGHVVYFDFFGLFLMLYDSIIGIVLNIVIVILGFFTCFAYLYDVGKRTVVYKQLLLSMGAQLCGWISGTLLCCLLGLFLDGVNRAMSWYASPWLVIGLFSVPTLLATCFFTWLFNIYNEKKNILGLNVHVHINILANILIWCIVLFIMSCLALRSAHVILFMIIFPIFAMLLITFTNLRQTVRGWLYVYLAFIFIPVLYNMYECVTLLEFFVPISGRIGADKIVDIHIGFLTAFSTIVVCSLFIPLISLVRHLKYFMIGLLCINIITIICVFTPLGFPYASSPGHRAPQRYWIYHTERIFYNTRGGVRQEDAGFFLINMDRNSPNMVSNYVDEIKRKTMILDISCEDELYCGVPMSSARMNLIIASSWIPTTPPVFYQPTHLKLINQTVIRTNVRRLHLVATGPDQMSLFISAKPQTELVGWSFLDSLPPSGPLWNNRSTYFITYGRGKESSDYTMKFYLDIAIPSGWTEPVVDTVLIGHFKHHESMMTPAYKNFVGKFPEWTQVSPWISAYRAYVF